MNSINPSSKKAWKSPSKPYLISILDIDVEGKTSIQVDEMMFGMSGMMYEGPS